MPNPAVYTFGSARDELQLRMGRSAATSDSGFTARLTNWLDSAQQKLAGSFIDIPELDEAVEGLPLVSGQAEYNYTQWSQPLTDLLATKSIKNTTTGYKMRRFPYNEYLSLTTQSQGDPFRWARRGFVYAFDPEPDDAFEITVSYRRYPELGVLIGPRWHEDVIRLATFLGWSALLKSDLAKVVYAELPANLQIAVTNTPSQEDLEAYFDPDLSFTPFYPDYNARW